MSDNIFLIRAVDILWCGDMLLYCGTEDGNVEGGPWLGELAHLHLRVMAPGRHGGSSDRPGRAQEAEPWHLQGSISNGLQTGSGGKQRGQHWEVLDGATGLFNHSIISVNPITWIIESLNHSSNQLINHFIISSFHNISLKVFVVCCVFFAAKLTTIHSRNEDGELDFLFYVPKVVQTIFLETGLLACVVVVIIAQLMPQIVASLYPVQFLGRLHYCLRPDSC